MKYYSLLVFVFLLPFVSLSQVDNSKVSITIPAVETDDEETNETNINITNDPSLKTPNKLPELKFPKKEFSMFPQEDFANPGDLYTKKLDKIEKDLLPEGHGENSGLKEDAYWGDYKTSSDYVMISYRDYGQIDGDYLEISVNDEIVNPRVFLGQSFSGFKLHLKDGFNRIEFKALNEGAFLPNTAQYRITDQWGKLISGKVWALAKGVKVTVIIIKE